MSHRKEDSGGGGGGSNCDGRSSGGSAGPASKQPSCEFLDNFEKCYETVVDRKPIKVTPQFCFDNFKKNDKNKNNCGPAAPSANNGRLPPASTDKSRAELSKVMYGPFDPMKEGRSLAYQPLKSRKAPDRRISTNTLHGIESVNDLRAWSFSKEERRKHYLEQMIGASSPGGDGVGEQEKPALIGYERKTNFVKSLPTQAVAPTPRPHHQPTTHEIDRAISDEYHREKARLSSKTAEPASTAAGAGPAANSKGSKEVQTPKLSITNLLEELSEQEQDRLFDALEQIRPRQPSPTNSTAAAGPNDSAKDDEIKKLRARIRELQDKYEKLLDDKDQAIFNLVDEQKKMAAAAAAAGASATTINSPAQAPPAPTPECQACHDCELQLLQAEYAVLEFDNLELQRQLVTERGRIGGILQDYNSLQEEYEILREAFLELESRLGQRMDNEVQLVSQEEELMNIINELKREQSSYLEMNRTLEQEVVQLRAQIGSLYGASTRSSLDCNPAPAPGPFGRRTGPSLYRSTPILSSRNPPVPPPNCSNCCR